MNYSAMYERKVVEEENLTINQKVNLKVLTTSQLFKKGTTITAILKKEDNISLYGGMVFIFRESVTNALLYVKNNNKKSFFNSNYKIIN